jgi:hypothetical protein
VAHVVSFLGCAGDRNSWVGLYVRSGYVVLWRWEFAISRWACYSGPRQPAVSPPNGADIDVGLKIAGLHKN